MTLAIFQAWSRCCPPSGEKSPSRRWVIHIYTLNEDTKPLHDDLLFLENDVHDRNSSHISVIRTNSYDIVLPDAHFDARINVTPAEEKFKLRRVMDSYSKDTLPKVSQSYTEWHAINVYFSYAILSPESLFRYLSQSLSAISQSDTVSIAPHTNRGTTGQDKMYDTLQHLHCPLYMAMTCIRR